MRNSQKYQKITNIQNHKLENTPKANPTTPVIMTGIQED